MKVKQLIKKLQSFPPNAEVEVTYKTKDIIGYQCVETENFKDIGDVVLIDCYTPHVQIVIHSAS